MQDHHPFFRQLLDNLYDGVYFVDRDRIITYWNRGAERLSGYSADLVLGKSCRDNLLVHMDDNGKLLCLDGCPLAATMADGNERQAEVFMHHADGQRVPVLVRVSPIHDEAGAIVGAVEIFSDNSSQNAARQQIEELQELAFLDPLTALANRRFLEITLHSRLEEQRRYGWPFGVLFFDIDHFKSFNDSYGHETGDAVLKMTAKTLAGCARSFDVVGRWGGEEFVAVLANVDRTSLQRIAERYRSMIEQSGLPTAMEVLRVTVSVGAALAVPGDTVESVLERADALMYQSKQNGRNRVTLEGVSP
ncbi:sensor domain-containing diguanylate cyclase [Desulfuromonas carbonis]|uniref:sensor domain-containing diguanylate cyclase n=1 Tax=Desulfuromonas sp. DDH964 TaxID=1823759 RepID=UPI00078EA517|nr:GGDEF domain-containing protein [Desulfuromonas sp. DDH964]AMV73424.1 sensor diguanylate cyclase, PAS domain-containing [Desulfuromonas sp. DDH964]